MIRLDCISKKYNDQYAVHDLSFEVKEQETMVLLGTSGCGKTTTLRMINRLTDPDAGTIYINNKNILQQPPEILRRNIGYVLQNHGLFPHYTVAENIAVVPQLLKWPKDKIRQRIHELVEKLQLPVRLISSYPGELSGGQQQRVGLARALAADPDILLMDEPFGALDPVTKTAVRSIFSSLDELKRKTVVLVTHDVQEAFELGDRICLMDKGSIMQTGTPADLLFRPASSFVSQFFDQQRLQLELRSLTINDVWHTLPVVTDHSESRFNMQDDLWKAMEAIIREDKNIHIYHPLYHEVREISFSAIRKAIADTKLKN